MKHKKSFLAANPPDGFSTNRDTKYPMPTVKYTAGSLMWWACFSAGSPGHLVQKHGFMDSKSFECHDFHNIKGHSLKDDFNYTSDIGEIIDIKYAGNDCKLSIIQRRLKIN